MKTLLCILSAGIIACTGFLVPTSASEPGILWEIRNHRAKRMPLRGVAANNTGRMVAVGAVGTILVSDDHGSTWFPMAAGILSDLHAITWTGQHFVAVGGAYPNSTVILTSTDGIRWFTVRLPWDSTLGGVAASPSTCVVTGSHELLAHSSDLVAWHAETNAWNSFLDVVWTGSLFVAVGNRGIIKTSPDGVTWTSRESGLGVGVTLNAVSWNGSTLVAAGFSYSAGNAIPEIIVSSNGIDWTHIPTSAFPNFVLHTVEWTGTRFVAMGDLAHTLTSPDGTTWTHHQAPGTVDIYGLCWDGTRLVAVGRGLEALVLGTSESAPDEASDWTILAPADNLPNLNDICTSEISPGLTRTLMVGSWGAMFSSDNELNTLVRRDAGTEPYQLLGITETSLPSARFLAVGTGGTILTSPDAITWTPQSSGVTHSLHAATWFPPNDGSASFAVVVGDAGTILTSEDATHWTHQSTPTTKKLKDVATGRTLTGEPPSLLQGLVCVGEDGAKLYSFDGIHWHEAPATRDLSLNLQAVASLQGGFVAVGNSGTVLLSVDAIHWIAQDSGTIRDLLDVAWTGSQTVATGARGTILTSPTGTQWTRRYTTYSGDLKAVAELPSGRLGAVGNVGLTLVSDQAPDFDTWIAAQSPPFGQSGANDDPNGDGIRNILACALDIPAVASPAPEDFPKLPRMFYHRPGKPMTVVLRPAPEPLGDISYVVEVSATMQPGTWTEVLRHLPGQACGSGIVELVTSNFAPDLFFVLPETLGERTHYFTRLRVEQTP